MSVEKVTAVPAGELATVLELNCVAKSFPGVKALDDVDFQLRPGEVHGLVGENGAGKSTLMDIASGVMVPNSGAVMLMGENVTGRPDRVRAHGVAIVRQEPLLLPDLSVAENIYLGIASGERPPVSAMEDFARSALRSWSDDIDIDVSLRVSQLPPPERFIIEIVKAFANKIRVLVLDEPTEHLVAEDVDRLFSHIRSLVASGGSVVYISHRINEVRSIADRVTVLRDGRAVGTQDVDGLTEAEIIALIVGKQLAAEFPAKAGPGQAGKVVLEVLDWNAKGLDPTSLTVRSGEIVGLAGISDNGQREFLRSLAGLNPGRGVLRVDGRDVTVRNPWQSLASGFAFLPDDRHREGMSPEQSVMENFTIRSLHKDTIGPILSHGSQQKRTLDAIREFAVRTPATETRIKSLSGGNQQKIVLASVIANGPRILLIDEPTQGVDIGARAEIYRKLREMVSLGMAVIVVSSDAFELAGLCDRICVFSRGRLAASLIGEEVTEGRIITEMMRTTSEPVLSADIRTKVANVVSGDMAPIAAVALCAIATGVWAAVVNPSYLAPNSLFGLMVMVATLAIVAYGQQTVLLVGGIDLSVGPVMGLMTVVGSFFLLDDVSLSMQGFGWICALAIAGGVGLANFALIEALRLHPMIATLATYMGVQALSLVLRPTPAGMIDFDVVDVLYSKISFIPVAFVFAVALGLGLEYVLRRTGWGIAFRAHGSNAAAAEKLGVSAIKARLAAYVGASLLAGLAGLLMIGQVGIGDARSGISYTLSSVAACVVGGASLFGGRGSFIGALFGALLVTQVNQVTAYLRLDAAWNSYLMGAMVLVSVLLYSIGRKSETSS